jgi:hypothetical protein
VCVLFVAAAAADLENDGDRRSLGPVQLCLNGTTEQGAALSPVSIWGLETALGLLA